VYRENEREPAFLEVLSPVQLRERLQAQPYDLVRVTLLAGTHFVPRR
jgi:CTP-dependent riboflavin kinase